MSAQVVELELLRAAAAEISAAAWGTGTAVAMDWAGRLCMSKSTLLKKLKEHGFYDSGRKTRADKGNLSVTEEVALQAAGLMHLGTRANGKRNFSTLAAAEMLSANGFGRVDKTTGEVVQPSATTLARAMRQYRCHPDQLAAGHPALSMRSLHPNHVWEVDSSVCVLFYAPGGGIKGIKILDDTEVYKNKPDAIARVQGDLCIRWLVIDHYSGAYFVRYFAGHEDSIGYINFMIEAMQNRDEPFHGVPKIILMDKGCAARAATARNLHKRMGIEVLEHAVKNSRAKGSAEGGHDIWEGVFESRLFMWLPPSVEALNERADMVRRAHNAGKVHSRHRQTRYAMWQRITADQLHFAPSVDLMRELVTTAEETRVVNDQMMISYATKKYGSQPYYLASVPGVAPRDTVTVVVNAFRAPAIDVVMTAADGTQTLYTVEPAEKDAGGFNLHGNVWGEEIKGMPKTDAERQLSKVLMAAYGVPTQAEADAERKARNANAYDGQLNPWADFEAVPLATFLPKRGTEHVVAAAARVMPPVELPDAVRQIKAGGNTDSGLYARLAAEYGTEVPWEVVQTEIAAVQSAPSKQRASA